MLWQRHKQASSHHPQEAAEESVVYETVEEVSEPQRNRPAEDNYYRHKEK